jgi:hypothetical protein
MGDRSNPAPRVAVLGAGAVGSYFGGMLARAGVPVTLRGPKDTRSNATCARIPGISDEACDFHWEDVRCAMLHRPFFGGMRSRPLRAVKLGRQFVLDEKRLSALETSVSERPYTITSMRRNKERTVLWVLWIEPFYWALRIAIPRAISTQEKGAWIKSGDWDRTEKKAS